MSNLSLLCRFCAQEDSQQNVIDLKKDKIDRHNIKLKLSIFSEEIINFNNEYLPETVCTTCYAVLCKSHEFFTQVRNAQVVLDKLFKVAEVKDQSSIKPKEEFDVLENDTNDRNAKPDFDSSIAIASVAWSAYPWICAHCTMPLLSMEAMREHKQAHHQTCYGFICADCGETIDTYDEFLEHVWLEREDLKKYCEYCNMEMENSTHRETHNTNNKCMYCGQTFNSELSLIEHLKKYATKTEGTLRFEMEIYEDELQINDVDIESWSEYPSICVYCNIKVADQDILKAHCLSAHKSCFGMKCVDCDNADVRTYEEFVQHVRRHRPNLKNVCQYCNSDNMKEGHMNIHIGRHQCKICNQKFHRIRDLRRHDKKLETPLLNPPTRRRRIGPIADEDLICNVCGKVMKNPLSLRAHKLIHTERRRNHTCERCGKAFYLKGSLEEHRKIHEDIMKETCKICNKSFLNVQRLRKHVITHNTKKINYQCDDCKKFFNTKDRLRNHVYVHQNIKPYKCEYCPKSFRYRQVMKNHENQHTGARPYNCDVCFFSFSCWSNCDKHMRRIHGKPLAKAVWTPHGKLAINPETGKPSEVNMTSVVQEWSKNILDTTRKCKMQVQIRNNS